MECEYNEDLNRGVTQDNEYGNEFITHMAGSWFDFDLDAAKEDISSDGNMLGNDKATVKGFSSNKQRLSYRAMGKSKAKENSKGKWKWKEKAKAKAKTKVVDPSTIDYGSDCHYYDSIDSPTCEYEEDVEKEHIKLEEMQIPLL